MREGESRVMQGMGSYTPFERELSHLSIDELNELYLTGELDKMYDKFEKEIEGRLIFSLNRKKKTHDKGEVV